MKRILIIDCQLLQTNALHRGMGKYTLAVLQEYVKLNLPYDRVIVLLSSHKSNLQAESAIKPLFQNFEVKKLPLKNTKTLNPEEYTIVLESNRGILDKYIEHNFSDYSVDFLITSLFQENTCAAFPSFASNKYLLVYDLIPLQFPHYYLKDKGGQDQYLSRYKELFNATHYFTISNTVANDLSLQLGINLKNITPIGGSYISRKKLKPLRPTNLVEGKKFILMPTGDDARKNNLRTVVAFEDFNSKSGYVYKLVITSFFSDKTKNELLMRSNHVTFTGNVAEDELAWLYANAELILFPSEYEGLGMPPLEAVEFDKPVLCSSIDVFKEISETAFYFCDPYNLEEISHQLQELLINNKPQINKKEYKRILSEYSWEQTAKRMLVVYDNALSSPAVEHKEHKKRVKIAVFGPVPSGYSAIGKVLQEQHYELSQLAEVDYYLEDGITERAQESNIRVNFLPYIANCLNPWSFDRRKSTHYDLVIYHIGNSEYHIATIIKALAFPGEIVLHDTGLKEIFSLIRDRGYISASRYAQEEALQKSIHFKKGIKTLSIKSAFIASLTNVSKKVVVHSTYAQSAVEQMFIASKNVPEILKINLPTPTPFIVYDIAPSEYFVVGYAGVLHPAKGLNLIESIAKRKYKKPVVIKLFGFSLLDKELKDVLSNLNNVSEVLKPSDARFVHELESCNIIVGFRPDYHGETSLSTLESLRLGKPVIVNNIGWFKELPDGVVYKVSKPEEIAEKIAKVIITGDTDKMTKERVRYVRENHSVKEYVLGLIGAQDGMD